VTLRVGIIGTGFARRVQLPAFEHVPGIRAVAVASGHRANAEATAREFNIPRVYDDGDALVRDPEVDAVFVASTPPTHARYAIAALEAGKHVLCEKPAALNAREAAAMAAAARRHPDRLAWMDHELRYEPNRRKVADLIRAGAIGDVRHMELVLRPYFRSDGRGQTNQDTSPWSWWYDAAQGGGVLGAVASHLIDLCRFWGGAEVREVTGGVATWVKQRPDDAGVGRRVTAEEFGSFVLFLSSGAVATLTLSAVAFHGPGHFAQITGRAGSIVLTGESRLELGRPGEPLEDVTAPDELLGRTKPNSMWARGFVRLLRDFVGAAGGGRPAGEPATFADGLAVQRVLDAVRAGGATRLD
jgi:predicted dehydrogenase